MSSWQLQQLPSAIVLLKLWSFVQLTQSGRELKAAARDALFEELGWRAEDAKITGGDTETTLGELIAASNEAPHLRAAAKLASQKLQRLMHANCTKKGKTLLVRSASPRRSQG